MKKLMLGNEAVARGAYEAGVRVVSSYPGTPSTEITEFCAAYPEIDCEWAPNEKVAVETAFGAAMTGARAMSCMKHVGVNVAADPLYTAAYTGVNAGMVIVAADDPYMHSSQNEQDSRMIARAAHIPMLEPADSQECHDYIQRAFELSERYDTPVFLRLTTRLAHQRSPVEIGERAELPVREYKKDFMKYVMMPGMARKRHLVVEAREQRMEDEAASLGLNRVEMRGTALGVVCAGVVYQYVREALPEASILKLGLSYPMDRAAVRDFAARVDKLVVIEELEGIFEQEIAAMGIAVTGAEKAHGRDFSRRSVAVLGDSTFIHSGITGLINAVYDRSNINVIILDNRITGMTGHQQNPATGFDIHGNPAPQLNLEAVCEAVGAHVRVVNPMQMKDMKQALREETQRDGVSVIIARYPCALLDKRPKQPCTIADCHRCGACLRLGCPALERGADGAVRVNAALCNGCGLCKQMCAFGCITGGGEKQ